MNKRAGLSTEFVAMEFIKKKRSREDSDKAPDKRVRINVGGSIFETWRSTLERIPGTRLALMAVLGESDDTWDKEKKEFFFDRHPGVFSMVMQYYRTEELHTDQNFCGNIIQGELDFWGLTELDIEPCCWGQYSKFKDHRETLAALDENFTQQTEMEAWTEKTTNYQRFKHRVWQFIEEPSTSRAAKIYAVFSMFFVVLSIAIFCLETYHWFRVPIPDAKSHNATGYETYFAPTGDQCIKTKHESGKYSFSDTEPHPAMTYLDYVCAAYFTIEYLTRFFFAPGKWRFIKGPLNVIDLLCLIPHLIAIIMVTVDPYGSSKDTSNLFRAFLALRTVRILRIFKLMKHYSAFKILVYTIKVSTKELLLLVIFLFTGVLIFASIIFYTENDTFDSIPVGFWWALVTMTTVGYGDKVPRTEGGYIIGCVCVLCGVLTVAFTVPIVVNNFTLYYSHAQSRIKLPVHKRKELKRKIFLKNQKSLEFLQKLKWRRGKHNTQFSDLDTLQTPRDPPCGQEAAAEVTTPPKTSRVTLLMGTEDDNSTSAALFHKNAPSPTIVDEVGRASGSHNEDKDKNQLHSGRKNTSQDTSNPGTHTPVERIHSPVERMTIADRFQVTPERIHTVSESINFSLADSVSFSVPGTPSDASMNTEQHIAETEQLLHDLADADKKRKDERKRQLSLINQKRESRRQQISSEPKKPPVFEGGSSKSTC